MSDEPESNNAGTSAMDWSTNAESSEDDDFDESDEVVGEVRILRFLACLSVFDRVQAGSSDRRICLMDREKELSHA